MTFKFESAKERWEWYKKFAAGEFEMSPMDNQGFFYPEEIGKSLENVYQENANSFQTFLSQLMNYQNISASVNPIVMDKIRKKMEIKRYMEDYDVSLEEAIQDLNEMDAPEGGVVEIAEDPAKQNEWDNYAANILPEEWDEYFAGIIEGATKIMEIANGWQPDPEQTVIIPMGFSGQESSAENAKNMIESGAGEIAKFGMQFANSDVYAPMNIDDYMITVNNFSDFLRMFAIVNTQIRVEFGDSDGV